ncbi:MAG: MarR family transcriptional regulator [Myxococcota bacterium]|nr:MarR family transcriptional regulator [Myxococcota bacterium]
MKQQDHYRQILRLVNGIGRLTNPQHLPALRERRISLAQFLALDALGNTSKPMRMRELAESAGLATTELTRVVTSLEEKGWTERRVDPNDSRARQVVLTRSGKTLIKRVQREANADLRDVWSDLTHDEWHRFIDLMQRFESGLRRVRAGARDKAS